jgi:hypothetical protein
MTVDRRRTILEELARGNLTTAEAEHHLSALDSAELDTLPDDARSDDALPDNDGESAPSLAGGDADQASTGPDDAPPPLNVRAKLSGAGCLEVVGDEAATEVRVEGPHSCALNVNDSVTNVSGLVGDDGLLVVPANADLDIEVNSGEARLVGLRGVLRTRLNVGDAVVECALTRGHSTIDANAGDLRIVLAPESDVRVAVRCAADVRVDPGLHKVGRGEWTLGEGTARLEITGHLGSVAIGTER